MTKKIILVVTLIFIGFWAKAQNSNNYIDNYLIKWDNSQAYLLEVIAVMPADKMDYKPTESAKSFRDITTHIVSNMVWLSSDYLGQSGFESDFKNKDISKNELIELVKLAFSYSREAVANFPEEKMELKNDFFAGPLDAYQIMRLMNDHCTHHRGQLALYLRLNDLPVPKYVGW